MRKTGQNQRKKELFEEEHSNTQSRLEANVYDSDKKITSQYQFPLMFSLTVEKTWTVEQVSEKISLSIKQGPELDALAIQLMLIM